MFKKNVTRQLAFILKDTSGNAVTGLGSAPVVSVSKDGGSFTGASNAIAEIANGWYKVTLTATELNADVVAVKCTGSGALQTDLAIYTVVTVPDDTYTRLGVPAGASTAADIAEVKGDTGAVENTVWNATAASHTTAGSTGAQQNHLDADVSTRLATTGYTAPLSAGATANAVWDEDLATHHTTADTAGKDLATAASAVAPSAATVAAAVWDEPLSGHATAGTAAVYEKHLDADVSTRLATSGYTAPSSVAAIADGVWDEDLSGHTTAGTAGETLASAGGVSPPDATTVANAVWDAVLTSHTTASSAAVYVKHLDADVTTRLATSGYTAPPSVGAIRTELDTNSTKLDAAVSTRLATSGYTAPLSAGATANAVWDEALSGHMTAGTAGEKLNNAAAGSAPTASQVAVAVWNEVAASHTTTGSTGQQLNTAAAGSGLTAADVADAVWDEDLSTHSTTGTAGVAAQHLDADVTSRASATDYSTARATKLDNLDATVSSRLAAGSYSAAPSAATVASAVWEESAAAHTSGSTLGGRQQHLNADISTRLAAADYTAPTDPPTVVEITAGIWGAVASANHTTGTMGERVYAAGSAADPLLNLVPGTYLEGSAGWALGRLATEVQLSVNFPTYSSDGTNITLLRGDDYLVTDGLALQWTKGSNVWPTDLTDAELVFTIQSPDYFQTAGIVLTPTGTQVLQVELTAIQTSQLGLGARPYDIQAVLSNGSVRTLVAGRVTVVADVTTWRRI